MQTVPPKTPEQQAAATADRLVALDRAKTAIDWTEKNAPALIAIARSLLDLWQVAGLTIAIVLATATAAPAADTYVTYWCPDPHLPAIGHELVDNANTYVRLATWELSDGTLAGSLCTAASTGVNVQVALNLTGGSNTAQNQIVRQLTSSGGTVWSCNFPRTIANNFLTRDGQACEQGNYYWSPTAVQAGSYLTVSEGTAAAHAAETTFAGLVSGGTIAAAESRPPLPHRAKHPTGAKPSARHTLMTAPRYQIRGTAPLQYSVVPTQLLYWGNDQYGDCVTAEEAFAKAESSTAAGGAELLITNATAVAWAKSHGVLNGADLTSVMDGMATSGFATPTGTWGDGPYSAVDWQSTPDLTTAIAAGPVKLGIASGQLQNLVNDKNGWIATGLKPDANEDHCVSLCGYGTMSYCCQTLGVNVPPGVDGTAPAYLLFTWATLGVIDQPSLNAITGEAWLRQPTTVLQAPSLNKIPPLPSPAKPSPASPTRIIRRIARHRSYATAG